LPVAELEARLNTLGVPYFEASASRGDGVHETLLAVAERLRPKLQRLIEEEIGIEAPPAETAPEPEVLAPRESAPPQAWPDEASRSHEPATLSHAPGALQEAPSPAEPAAPRETRDAAEPAAPLETRSAAEPAAPHPLPPTEPWAPQPGEAARSIPSEAPRLEAPPPAPPLPEPASRGESLRSEGYGGGFDRDEFEFRSEPLNLDDIPDPLIVEMPLTLERKRSRETRLGSDSLREPPRREAGDADSPRPRGAFPPAERETPARPLPSGAPQATDGGSGRELCLQVPRSLLAGGELRLRIILVEDSRLASPQIQEVLRSE